VLTPPTLFFMMTHPAAVDAKARYDWKLTIARRFLYGNTKLGDGGTDMLIALGGRSFGELRCQLPNAQPEQLLHDPNVPIRLRVVIDNETVFCQTYRIADLRGIASKMSNQRKPFFPWNRTWHHVLWPEILKELPESA
jgi:hypothetical protein